MRAVSPVTQGRAPIFLNGRQLSRLSFLGFVWGCTARLRRTSEFLRPNSFLGSPSEFLENFCLRAPLCVSIPLCRLSVPQEAPFLFLAQCTTAWPTFLSRGRWTLLGLQARCPSTSLDGPYRVLKPGHKHFILDFGGRQEVVSMDQLKPAHDLPIYPPRPTCSWTVGFCLFL